jgi:nucleotide-binding universal stress UspA family protein
VTRSDRAIETIVVGFDGSDAAKRALARAADLAEALGASLVITSVAVVPVPVPGADATLPAPSPAERFADAGVAEFDLARDHLDEARTALEERGVDAEYVSETGAPAERIVALAEARDAELIVVGTHEPGFVERLLQGSVSQDVSRSAHRDVLIVH